MKTFKRNNWSLGIAFVLALCLVIQPLAVFAADASSDAQQKVTVAEEAALEEMNLNLSISSADETVQPRAHISYYPSSGASSGYFSGAISDRATYSNLPSGKMKFSYSMSGGTTCYLRFYFPSYPNGTCISSVALNANDYTGSGSITLPWSGQYQVAVYNPNGSSTSELIYAFNLYTD